MNQEGKLWAEVLSPSAIEMFETCPKQYYYKVKGFKEQPWSGWSVGSCFHQAIETYVDMRYKKPFKKALEWSLLNTRWWPKQVAEEVLRIWVKWKEHHTMPSIVEVGNLVFPLTELPFGPIGDKVHGVVVKKSNSVTFESGLKIHGFIDMIYAEPLKTGGMRLVVVDWKTNRFKIPALYLKRQAQVYALAVHKMTGLPVRVEFAFVRFHKDRSMIWTPTMEELGNLENELANLQTYIKNLDASKAVAKIGDSCKFCSWNHTCKPFQDWIKKPDDGYHIWHTMPLEDLIIEYETIRTKFNAQKRVVQNIKDIILHEMDLRGLDSVGNYEIRHNWDDNWDEHAQKIIEDFDGKQYVPKQIMRELQLHHRIKEAGSPYLWKV